ncbi:MAG: hypothetical protein M3P42_04815 [Actinomycetota bacterium]|nr:hypothetical protein [Actinomycetota bacterium]
MGLFGVFGDAARLYILLWRRSLLPAAALSALYYRLTDPARPVIAPRHSSSGSAWDEHALEDARQAR